MITRDAECVLSLLTLTARMSILKDYGALMEPFFPYSPSISNDENSATCDASLGTIKESSVNLPMAMQDDSLHLHRHPAH